MGYYMHFYGKSGDPVAQHVRDDFVAKLAEADVRADIRIGADWIGVASLDVTSDRDPRDQLSPLLQDLTEPAPSDHCLNISIITRPDLVRDALDQVGAAPDSPDLSWCDTFVEMRLSGDHTDWFLVRNVWSVAIDLWHAVCEADGSGFDTTIHDLPTE